MAHFIDRRLNGKNKSAVNRQRFIRRYKSQIKRAVNDAVNQRSIQDLENSESISIPHKDITEPFFHQGEGGHRQRTLPGNDQFGTGDKIERPPQGEGGGGPGDGDASDQGEGSEEFQFNISKDEYLDILFDDLELPNLQETDVDSIVEYRTARAGFTNDGVPANINIVRSLQNSLARRMAMGGDKRKRLRALETQLEENKQDSHVPHSEIEAIKAEITELKRKLKNIPFIDTFDLKFNNFAKHPVPSSQAVMFCLMDVSGSMDQATKDIAKRFYLLLYLFLTRSYEKIDVVFIRHHTQAKEVDEHEFFYSQETGGTIVSSALNLMDKIIEERYPKNQWNIYAAQASDGDNWADDSPKCRALLEKTLLPLSRHYAYIEITSRAHQSLWHEYEQLSEIFPNFSIRHVKNAEEILPTFRDLFKKTTA
ncbi:YeaH/YhbH family protein [Agarivorans sp. 1_MG-2023]|uniref:YeaH/YhbH family protein n=1 Tax=Agarivorans sp. 1_MG-2023 TaxID=3062634 RepID=UPI0026E146A0|nr:YeaH/YhbH family protein [Agarivorans sp. 1_MG-2023]MDO6761954.1 YeaH/YhbH family protein [Agarivorans sp. 1_MG-2023]